MPVEYDTCYGFINLMLYICRMKESQINVRNFQINFIVASLLAVTGLLVRILSTKYLLAALILGAAIVECTMGVVNFWKSRRR